MSDPERSKALKVVLIVLGVLAGTTLVCCGGLWLAGVRVADEVQEALGPTVQGSGVAAVQERLVEGFQGIRVEGLIDVDVRIGPETSVTLQADDNILPLITTEVVEGTLVFSTRANYQAATDLRATVIVPSLRSVEVLGIGGVTVRGLDEPAFSVALHGIGSATVDGRAEALDVVVEGSGDAHLSRLVARRVRADVRGIGDAEVHATESLEASVRGMGDVIYSGAPADVRRDVQGMGNVIPAVE